MTQHPLADALREAAGWLEKAQSVMWHQTEKVEDRVRSAQLVIAKALAQYEKSDTDRDQLREALTAEEQRAVSEELETLAKRWECSGRYSSNRVSAFYRAALASKTAIDPATIDVPKCAVCSTVAPEAFAKTCARPECPHRVGASIRALGKDQ